MFNLKKQCFQTERKTFILSTIQLEQLINELCIVVLVEKPALYWLVDIDCNLLFIIIFFTLSDDVCFLNFKGKNKKSFFLHVVKKKLNNSFRCRSLLEKYSRLDNF